MWEFKSLNSYLNSFESFHHILDSKVVYTFWIIAYISIKEELSREVWE